MDNLVVLIIIALIAIPCYFGFKQIFKSSKGNGCGCGCKDDKSQSGSSNSGSCCCHGDDK